MPEKRFHSIKGISEMISYLKQPQRLNNVKSVNKYTSLKSVIDIFSTQRLLLNNPENMNDLYEYHSFNEKARWKKICFTSFIAQKGESMAMWSMYAQPWTDGVMMSIPASAIIELIQNTDKLIGATYDEKSERYIPDEGMLIPSNHRLFIHRIAYLNGLTLSCTGRDDRNTNFEKPYEIPEFAGYVKDASWDYEKEIRLRADLPTSYECNVAYLKLPESFLKQIKVITGPRFKGNVLMSIPKKYRSTIRIECSKFTEKLAWTPCDGCKGSH